MDIGRPDEFLTHEANAVAGQAGVFIGKGRITQIHVDLGSRYREGFHNSSSLRRRGGSFRLLYLKVACKNNAV